MTVDGRSAQKITVYALAQFTPPPTSVSQKKVNTAYFRPVLSTVFIAHFQKHISRPPLEISANAIVCICNFGLYHQNV